MNSNRNWKLWDRETKAMFKRHVILLFCLTLLLSPFSSLGTVVSAENTDAQTEKAEQPENDDEAVNKTMTEKDTEEADNQEGDAGDTQSSEGTPQAPNNQTNGESESPEEKPDPQTNKEPDSPEEKPEPEAPQEDKEKSNNVEAPEILAQQAEEKDPETLIDIPVKKEWIGAAAPSILIVLKQDGQIKKDLILKPDNNWEGVFSGLPKYERVNDESDFPPLFKEIDYDVEEYAPANYSMEKSGSVEEGFVFTNTNNDTIDIDVTKEWVGPELNSATFHLLANNVDTGKTLELTDADNWESSFDNLRKYDADTGEEIEYEVIEEELDGYTTHKSGSASEGYVFKNISHSTVNVLVEKFWNGESQPVTFKLLADDVETGQEMTLDGTESWGWTDRFTDLPKYNVDTGEEIEYDVDEVELDGYTMYKVINRHGAEDRFSFTNMENLEIEVTKEWVGEPYNYAMFYLKGKNDQILQNLSLNSIDDGWNGAFDPVQKYDYDTGELIEYYVEEIPIYGFNTTVTGSNEEGYVYTNISDENIEIDVEKKWVGKEGDSATFILNNADGKVLNTLELNEGNDWKGTFDGYPKYDSETGELIEYTVEEEEVPGYTTTVTGSNDEGYTFTNISENTMEILVSKYWFGAVSDAASFTLYADGEKTDQTMTLTDADKVNNPDYEVWENAFNVPKYNLETGEEIDYTVEETPIEGYKTNKFVDKGFEGSTWFYFDNIELIDIPVKKEWIGESGDAAIFHLVVNGEETDQTLELTADDNWEGAFEGLPTFDTDLTLEGVIEHEYDVVEADIEGYEMTRKSGSVEEGFTFTNTNNELIEIDVEKKWKGEKGDSATFILNNEDGKELQKIKVDASTDWKGTFEGQRKYDRETGELIEYTVEEEAIPGYTTKVEGSNEDGYTFTNIQDGLVTVTVQKYWYGDTADSATFKLMADGVETGDTLTLTDADDTGHDYWMGQFEYLPKYNAETEEKIEYTVEEEPIEGYETTRDIYGHNEDAPAFFFHNVKLMDINVTKEWEGEPGESATFHLVINGEKTDQTLKLTADDNWKGAFESLPMYNMAGEGEVIPEFEYDVVEAEIDGYTMTDMSGSVEEGFVFTNTQDSEVPEDEKDIGYVTIEHRDMNGTPLTKHITLSGKIGDTYTSEEKTFEGYELDRIEGDVSGVFTETPERVIYVYKPIESNAKDEGTGKDEVVVTIDDDGTPPQATGKMSSILPKTATPYYTIGLIGLLLVMAGGIVMIVRRKKNA